MDDKLFTITEAAEYMGLKRQTVRNMVAYGELAVHKRGERGGAETILLQSELDRNRAEKSGAIMSDYLTRNQAIEYLGISPKWFDNEVDRGNIIPVDVIIHNTPRRRFNISDLTNYKALHVTTPRGGLYKPAEAVKYLGISRQALNMAIINKRIEFVPNSAPYSRIKYLFTKAALDDYKNRPKNKGGRKKGGKNKPKE